MTDEVPASVQQARRKQGQFVGTIIAVQLVSVLGFIGLIELVQDTPYAAWAALGGIAAMILVILGVVFGLNQRLRESQEVIKAWEHLRSQAKAAELEAELSSPAKLHPLVEQVKARQASLGDEATALGKRLLQLEREQQGVADTLHALPAGPTAVELQQSLERVQREHADTLDALVRLYNAAQRGERADPALQGLLSEVRMPVEEPAAGTAERTATRQAERD